MEKTRKQFLNKNPLCEVCKERGVIKATIVVDHIIPHKGDERLFWDESNWQSLCKKCHDKKTMIEDRYKEYIYECSATVCKNAEMQPFKYLCKYFNIKPNEESLESFENVLNNFSAAKEEKQLLSNELEKIKESIKNDVPFLIRTFNMKKFMLKLGFKVIDFSILYFPVYTFRYVSPGGNKSTHCDIKLDINNLNNFVEYLSEVVKFRKSAENSTNGTTNHNPFNLKNLGNIEKPIIQNIKVFEKESNAEIFLFDKAVNNPEV